MTSAQDVATVAARVAEELEAWAAGHPAATLLALEVETARRLRVVQQQALSGLLAGRAPWWRARPAGLGRCGHGRRPSGRCCWPGRRR